MKITYLLTLFAFLTSFTTSAQFGYGITVSNDIYHRYSNPTDNIASPTAGSAILNLGVGPKLWVGGESFSVSVEGQAVLGMAGFSSRDYKGLGTMAVPLIAKLNFNGLSGLDKEGKLGLSLGGGLQYTRTEFYGLSEEFVIQGVERDFFKTYIAQAGYGFGINGFAVSGILRYGWNPDNDANVFTFGIQWDFNARQMKKIKQKASEL